MLDEEIYTMKQEQAKRVPQKIIDLAREAGLVNYHPGAQPREYFVSEFADLVAVEEFATAVIEKYITDCIAPNWYKQGLDLRGANISTFIADCDESWSKP